MYFWCCKIPDVKIKIIVISTLPRLHLRISNIVSWVIPVVNAYIMGFIVNLYFSVSTKSRYMIKYNVLLMLSDVIAMFLYFWCIKCNILRCYNLNTSVFYNSNILMFSKNTPYSWCKIENKQKRESKTLLIVIY